LIASLVEEHAVFDSSLDRLEDAIAASRIERETFRATAQLAAAHYRHEDQFLIRLQESHPALAAKLRAQHEEALEIAARLDESLAAGESDVMYLARRFLAIARHNIIEEERDVFPLFER
jgi:hypothetical protein